MFPGAGTSLLLPARFGRLPHHEIRPFKLLFPWQVQRLSAEAVRAVKNHQGMLEPKGEAVTPPLPPREGV